MTTDHDTDMLIEALRDETAGLRAPDDLAARIRRRRRILHRRRRVAGAGGAAAVLGVAAVAMPGVLQSNRTADVAFQPPAGPGDGVDVELEDLGGAGERDDAAGLDAAEEVAQAQQAVEAALRREVESAAALDAAASAVAATCDDVEDTSQACADAGDRRDAAVADATAAARDLEAAQMELAEREVVAAARAADAERRAAERRSALGDVDLSAVGETRGDGRILVDRDGNVIARLTDGRVVGGTLDPVQSLLSVELDAGGAGVLVITPAGAEIVHRTAGTAGDMHTAVIGGARGWEHRLTRIPDQQLRLVVDRHDGVLLVWPGATTGAEPPQRLPLPVERSAGVIIEGLMEPGERSEALVGLIAADGDVRVMHVSVDSDGVTSATEAPDRVDELRGPVLPLDES